MIQDWKKTTALTISLLDNGDHAIFEMDTGNGRQIVVRFHSCQIDSALSSLRQMIGLMAEQYCLQHDDLNDANDLEEHQHRIVVDIVGNSAGPYYATSLELKLRSGISMRFLVSDHEIDQLRQIISVHDKRALDNIRDLREGVRVGFAF